MSKETNAQKKVTAQTFRRLAKALRVRARNHKNAARVKMKAGQTTSGLVEAAMFNIYAGFAEDCDNEARTLRAMR